MITIERIIFGRVATPKEQRKENPASPSVANDRDLSNVTQISINEKNDVAEDNTTQHTRWPLLETWKCDLVFRNSISFRKIIFEFI